MATTGYDDRILFIEVSGLCHQNVMPTSHYTFKVPYRSLARALQFINRKGGKVVRINSLSLSLPAQGFWNTFVSLEDREVDKIGVQPSPPFEADLGKPAPSKIILADSESAQVSTVPEVKEFASPRVAESEIPKPSKLIRLIRLFLEKLNCTSQRKSTH
jgi:hypothetical protein